MKRRDFLKWIPGIAIVPSICTIGASKNINIPNKKFNSASGINFNNIKMDGTFDEWVESIRVEVERLLIPMNEDNDVYRVMIQSTNWGTKGNSMPAKAIFISGTVCTHFAFAKHEFERNKSIKKQLIYLVNTRFISMLWSLEWGREEYFKLLRRFDPKHETPDCYLH